MSSLILNPTFSIKLDRDNYLLWKLQLENVIIANELKGFINGTCPSPPKLMNNTLNPKYTQWECLNHVLMN